MMLARRQLLLSSAGLAGIGSTGGCLDILPDSEPAFLSYKGIEVQWGSDRVQRYIADLCWLWSDGHSRIFGWEPEEYPNIVQSATEVMVSREMFQRLQGRFSDVELVVGFSSVDASDLSLLESTFGQISVSRDRFNRIQFGDRIMVRPTDSGTRIRTVEKGDHGDPTDWTVAIGTKNLVDQFPDSNVPEPTPARSVRARSRGR